MRRSRFVNALLFVAACEALGAGLVSSNPLFAGDWRWWGGSSQQQEEAPPPDPTPGVRQTYYSRHVWPPQPRPTTRKARLIDQYYAEHYWPYPYTCEDRASVRGPIDQQTANGWIVETTLYGQHFDNETNAINQAGKMHLRWILLHAPPQYRAAFVATGETPAISQARMASVQAAATEMAGTDNVPPIMLRATQAIGTSAEERDLSRRKWLATIPAPRITYQGLQSASGSSTVGSN